MEASAEEVLLLYVGLSDAARRNCELLQYVVALLPLALLICLCFGSFRILSKILEVGQGIY